MSTPLAIADNAMLHCVKYWSPLVTLLPDGLVATSARVRRYDRKMDVRDVDGKAGLKGHVWIVPDDSPLDCHYGGQKSQWLLKYIIGYSQQSKSVADLRDVQYEIARAFMLMNDFILTNSASPGPALDLTTAYDPTPWTWDGVAPTAVRINKDDGIRMAGWRSLMNVTANLVGVTATIYNT